MNINKFILGIFIGVLIAWLAMYIPINISQNNAQRKDSIEKYEDHSHKDDLMNTNPAMVMIAENVSLTPISHASAVVKWGDKLIFADPIGKAELYTNHGTPDIVFITHRHGDHFDKDNLPAMLSKSTTLVAPQDVIDQLPQGITSTVLAMAPGETLTINPLTLQAVAAYNTRPEAQDYHPQSRGDIGIVLDDGISRVYFSGDTEGTPEMMSLENIDVAFVSMNLPYTMDVEAAAEAVLSFAPRAVYPYHFRTPDGFSDLERFKQLVQEGNNNITVNILDWYSEV